MTTLAVANEIRVKKKKKKENNDMKPIGWY